MIILCLCALAIHSAACVYVGYVIGYSVALKDGDQS